MFEAGSAAHTRDLAACAIHVHVACKQLAASGDSWAPASELTHVPTRRLPTRQEPLTYLRFDDFVHALTELAVLRVTEEREGEESCRGHEGGGSSQGGDVDAGGDVEQTVLDCAAFLKRLGNGVTTRTKSGRLQLRHKWPRQSHTATVGLALSAIARHSSCRKQRVALFKTWDASSTGVLSLSELRRGVVALSDVLNELHPCTGRNANSACLALMRRLATNGKGHVDKLTQQLFEQALEQHNGFYSASAPMLPAIDASSTHNDGPSSVREQQRPSASRQRPSHPRPLPKRQSGNRVAPFPRATEQPQVGDAGA